LSSEIRGTDQAIRNAMDSQALIDTAEGAHKEIENILQRMREVAVQAANDTNDLSDRANLNAEMKALTVEIDRIASVSTWAGQNLMNSSGSSYSFQVGTATGTKNQIDVTINSMATTTLGVKGAISGGAVTFADNGSLANGAVSSNSTVFTPKTSGTTTAAVATFTFRHTQGSTNTDFSFSSTTAYAATTGTAAEAIIVGTEIANKINSDETANGAVAKGIVASVDKTTGVITLSAKEFESVDSAAHARDAIKNIDAAIKSVNTQRSELGAVSNRLSHTVNNLTNISANLSAAKGGIEDADFAVETTDLAKNQILQQASTAMLAQANAAKQNVLSLLQG
jgi:flagellin